MMYKGFMLTKSDIQQLKNVFATKQDLEEFATKKDLEEFATKKYLEKFATKKDLEKFVTKNEFFAAFDALMHELKAIREELTVGSYRRSKNHDSIQNHEGRLTLIESKLSF
jgi:hypothetical protein